MELQDRTLERVQAQQEALAQFGSYAFNEGELDKVLTQAVSICAESLGVPFGRICQFDPRERIITAVATFGWHAGTLGQITNLDHRAPACVALETDQPVICHDLSVNPAQWDLPAMYSEHGIVSTVSVIIQGVGELHPYGVLECCSAQQLDFNHYDIRFLTGFANVVAERVATTNRIIKLRDMLAEIQHILHQKDVLLQELHHRVRNNLQLVYGMLIDAQRRPAHNALATITRRVLALAQVYDHLVGTQTLHTIDCSAYLTAICRSLAIVLHDHRLRLLCHVDPIILNLEKATALGLAVNELITACQDRAVHDQDGTISVRLIAEGEVATLSVQDDGRIDRDAVVLDKRHGLGLVQRLAQQLGGRLNSHTNGGTVTSLAFPIPAHDSAIKSH